MEENTEMISISKETLRSLASALMDTSVMLTPVSGLSMIGLAMMAKRVGELLGEEIKPNEHAYLGTVNTVSKIQGKLKDEIDDLVKRNEKLTNAYRVLKSGLTPFASNEPFKLHLTGMTVTNIDAKTALSKASDYLKDDSAQ